jgi:hypothetical protein
MAKKRMTEERRALLERARANAEWLRQLAEKGLAALPESARAERERAGSNAAWLRLLAEKAQADLDRRNQQRESA